MMSSHRRVANIQNQPSESDSLEMSVTDVRTGRPWPAVGGVQRDSPCKYQGGGDSIVSYMSSSAADLDYASDDSIADIPDISDEDISDTRASEFFHEDNTDPPDMADDNLELRAKMAALYNRIESRMDQLSQYDAWQNSPIGQSDLTTEKHVRFARSPQLITSPEASCISPNFLNDIAYSSAYKQDVCCDESNFYDVTNMVTERQGELRAKLRELNERTANRMRATTPMVLGNLLLNRAKTPGKISPMVQDMAVPNESTLSDSESDSSQWNTRYFYADDTQIQRQTPCVTQPFITIAQVSRPEVIGAEVKGQDERKETVTKSVHDANPIDIKDQIIKECSTTKKSQESVLTADEVRSKSDISAQSLGGTMQTRPTTAKKSKSDLNSKSEKKTKSGKKKANSPAHPRLPSYPDNSYVPSTRLVLPPIGCGENWVRSPCKTPEGFLPNIEECKEIFDDKVDQKLPRKRSRNSKTKSSKPKASDDKDNNTQTKIASGDNKKCKITKSDVKKNNNKDSIASDYMGSKLIPASNATDKNKTTISTDKVNNTITVSTHKVNKTITTPDDNINKTTTTSDVPVTKTTTTSDVPVTKTITASDDSGLGLSSGLDTDALFLRKAILQINSNPKTYGQQFVPLENTILNDPVNPALKTFATHSWRVLKFRAQFNRESILLPPIGKDIIDTQIERYPGKKKLGCQTIDSTINIEHSFGQTRADMLKATQFPIEAITPSTPSGKKPKVRRPPVKVKLPSAEEQKNIKQLIQQGNHLPVPPRTDKPHNRIKRSRATVRVPCVDTEEEEEDLNAFIKYF